MLLRPPVRRLIAALFAPWFAVVTAAPAAVHECAMHSPVAVHGAVRATPVSSSDAPMGMAHDHAAMMHHAAGAGAASAPGAPASPHRGTHQCSCPDGCCTASPAVAHAEAPLSWVPSVVLHGEPPFQVAAAPLADADHVLPFANGPPARS